MQQVFEEARKNMVDGQLLPNKITNPDLIETMRQIPRESFVPAAMQGIAYIDEDIALGNGRYLPEPLVLARLLQEAALRKTDVVLDIGCGTGYSTAVMSCLAGTVVGLEQSSSLANAAETQLRELGLCNVALVQQGDLRLGYAGQGPYNVILINGSVPEIPTTLLQQLADGGRLITVRASKGGMGTAIMVTRRGENFATKALFDAATPTLAGFEKTEGFVF